jgi:hypothetical protein
MEKEIKEIIILPARFIEKRDDKYLIKVLLEKEYTQDRLFDEYSLRGMVNPKYLLIGIMTGVGILQINFCQADDIEDLFKKKWKILTK